MKEELLELDLIEKLLKAAEVAEFLNISRAFATGVAFGSIQIMDNVHSVANVNTGKYSGQESVNMGR